MNRVDIMVDLETLGNTKDASMIQIAAAKFNIETGKILEEFNFYIDIEKTEELNTTGSTLRWWLKNHPELFTKIVNNGIVSEKTALELLHEFISKEEDPYLWGNGILFDNAIIQNKMKQYGLEYPIFFRNDRDVRTIVDLVSKKLGMDNKAFIEEYSIDFGDRHDALNDVKAQISYVVKAYQILTKEVL
jgi:hypothetical protein